jgi:hypothetical protein
MQGLGYNLLSSLTCSQIWLSSFVDDCQFTNLTKLGKKRKGKQNIQQNLMIFQKNRKKSLLSV